MSDRDDQLLKTADQIGRRLCRDAIWAGPQCNWLGWSMEPVDGAWTDTYRSLGPDLYGGTAGIALFLANLAQFTADPSTRTATMGATNHALGQLSRMQGPSRIGIFSGGAGIAWVLICVGDLMGREELVVRGVKELRSIGREPPNHELLDVVSGSAGLIPILLRAWRRFDCNELLDAAIKHGRFLLERANRTDIGWSWKTLQEIEQPDLTGHSHGVAGIVVALLELWRATDDAAFLEGTQQGLRYERRHFNSELGNWPDFRTFGQPMQQTSYGLAWCHGAPGIGLSRLRVYQLLGDDPSVRQEVEAALDTTLACLSQPFLERQGNFSLCHGLCGNAELPLVASDILQRPSLRGAAERIAALGFESIARHDMPWPCGTTYGKETPNLLLGTSGIGYFYLRLYDRQKVQPILLVAGEPSAAIM